MVLSENHFIEVMTKKTKQTLTDLASEANGSRALLASDEFFAPKENLLKAGRGEFIPEIYRSWQMDGWMGNSQKEI